MLYVRAPRQIRGTLFGRKITKKLGNVEKIPIYRPCSNKKNVYLCIIFTDLTIVYIIAMEAEARPFISHFGVEEAKGFFEPLPCKLFSADLDPSDMRAPHGPGDKLYVVLNGRQHGTDLVGCEAACVATMAAIQKLNPDLVVNSGTCGAFQSNGAEIAQVYLGNGAMFHDRRVPGDDAWGTQALGNYPVWDGTAEIARRLSLPMGKVTTGSSLDMQPCDREIIMANDGALKDMEGAAVAFVCSLYDVPVLFVKSVTDLCDNGAETYEEFSQNLARASEELNKANVRIIEEIRNLCCSNS